MTLPIGFPYSPTFYSFIFTPSFALNTSQLAVHVLRALPLHQGQKHEPGAAHTQRSKEPQLQDHEVTWLQGCLLCHEATHEWGNRDPFLHRLVYLENSSNLHVSKP